MRVTELMISLKLEELGSDILGGQPDAVLQAVVGRFLGILAQIPNLITHEVVVLRFSVYIMAFACSTDPPGVVEWLTARYQLVGVQEIARRIAAEDRVVL